MWTVYHNFSVYPRTIRIWNQPSTMYNVPSSAVNATRSLQMYFKEAALPWPFIRVMQPPVQCRLLALTYFTVLCLHTISALHGAPCNYSPHLPSPYSFLSELLKGVSSRTEKNLLICQFHLFKPKYSRHIHTCITIMIYQE